LDFTVMLETGHVPKGQEEGVMSKVMQKLTRNGGIHAII